MIARRTLLAAGAFSPLAAACATVPTARRGPELKLATFNIWHNQGDWAARRPLLIAALKAQGADVIALQEVLQDAAVGLENQASMLARELGGYRVAFVSTDPEGAPRRYGNALLTISAPPCVCASRFRVAPSMSSSPIWPGRTTPAPCAPVRLRR